MLYRQSIPHITFYPSPLAQKEKKTYLCTILNIETMKKVLKKTLKISLLGLLGIVAVAAVCVWAEFGAMIKGALSVQKLDDGLYYMEYSGDDGWDKLMEQGGFANANQLSQYAINFRTVRLKLQLKQPS